MQAPEEQWKNQPLIHYPGGALKHHLTLGWPYIRIPETRKFVLLESGTLGLEYGIELKESGVQVLSST